MPQKVEKFYDYQWKECEPSAARFVSIIQKTDSGYLRDDYFVHTKTLQMHGKFKDAETKIHDGQFAYFYPNGNLSSSGLFVNDKKQGVWVDYHYNGMMSDSAYYENGQVTGTRLGWHENGYIRDSTTDNTGGSGVYVSWFNDGNISSAGYLDGNDMKRGRWKYYHKNGSLSSVETYREGVLTDKIYYSEDGNTMADTSNKTQDARFGKKKDAWLQHLNRNLHFPDGYQITNADEVVVVVEFSVNEEGEVEDAYVSVPFYPAFDEIALKAVRNSPKWTPGYSHNRRVRTTHTQPVGFVQGN